MYMTIPIPYLKAEISDTGADPLAVSVTLGATSLTRHAERTPSHPIFAFTVPKSALCLPPTQKVSNGLSAECVVDDAIEEVGFTSYLSPSLKEDTFFVEVKLAKRGPLL